MTNHLANTSLRSHFRTAMGNLAIELADALIAKELACFENSRKQTAEDDSDALADAVEAAINAEFEIRALMAKVAKEISAAIRNA